MSTLYVNCKVCRINKSDINTQTQERTKKPVVMVHTEYCGNFSMAAGVIPVASPKEDYTNTTRPKSYPTSCLQSPKAPLFPASTSSLL